MSNDSLLWVEKYRPSTIDECILPQRIKDSLIKMGETGNIQNYSAVGLAGSGKTSSARALCEELGIDYLLINMSAESGVDTVRTKIINYASTMSFSSNYKTIILDECLEENEKVRVGTVDDWKAVALKDLKRDVVYPIVSFNMDNGTFENDTGSIISDKTDTVYDVIFESGRSVKVNGKHPFIVLNDQSYVDLNDNVIVDHSFNEKSIDDGLDEWHEVIISSVVDGKVTYTFDYVQSIIKDETPCRVINLTVYKNHTFIT